MSSVTRSALTLIATFLLIPSLHAQETCEEEVKLLLSPTQVQLAVPALQSRKETHRRIYFYDTPGLDLLKNSVVLRLREGAEIDITTKLRPRNGETFSDPSGGRERYKCEVNLTGGVENPSFSVQKKYVAAKVPETGEELFQLLTEGQRKLLEDSKVQIDWKRIKRLPAIQSTTWTTKAKPRLGKLSLELWEWPGGSVLEVSTKVAPDAGQATYAELKDLAHKNGLALNTTQRSKTGLTLEQITAAHPQ
jgi:CYTH domain